MLRFAVAKDLTNRVLGQTNGPIHVWAERHGVEIDDGEHGGSTAWSTCWSASSPRRCRCRAGWAIVADVTPTVVVSEIAWERFGSILKPAAPGVRWCVLHADGSVDSGGEQADIAWLSNDVFYSGALPGFLDLLRADDALRWVQSAGAGVDSPMFQELLGRGIRLTTTHATNVPIAEYVIGAVLRLYQQPEQWAASAARRGGATPTSPRSGAPRGWSSASGTSAWRSRRECARSTPR